MAFHVNIRRPLILLFKLAVSAFFIAMILRFARASDIVKNFSNLNIPYLISLIPFAVLIIWISCVKWKLLIHPGREKVSVTYLMRLYLLGYFFNNFLPSMVGGDAARGYYLGRRLDTYKAAYLSVFLERLTGLFALITLVAVLALGNHPLVQHAGIRVSLILLTLGLIAGVMAVFTRPLIHGLLRLLPARLDKLRDKLLLAHDALTSFRQQPGEFAVVLLLSLMFHVFAGVNVYLACRALNNSPALLDVVLVTPLIMIVSMLPISLNGAGVWEGSFAFFLALIGVPESIAVSAALLLRLKTVILSVFGWFVYLVNREKPKAPTDVLGKET